MRQGWILVDYFYNQLGLMDKSGTSLKDEIGPMVYGMEIERERHHAEQISFLPTGSGGDPAFKTGQRRIRSRTSEVCLVPGIAWLLTTLRL